MVARVLAWLCLMYAVGAILPPRSMARMYHNEEFGLSADLPEHLIVCTDEAPAPNRGFRVMLAPGDCDDFEALPNFSFSVSYNASLEYSSTPAIARQLCGKQRAEWSSVRVAGTRLMRCASPPRGGFELHHFVGLRPRPGKWFGEWTVVGLHVQCTRSRLPNCLAEAQNVARRIRWLD